ncbi:type II toxin-antitoxin system prevent-host-death family antitoxin [Microlunatus elymi]|uniref:Type II toxin-antitoxin system prevent-host-death family antitoxin n=1 Tax=Microlunatus elymi TaxID=2596828 RepID=A0A516Q374_9ACTN|nr:type II toxin-antitoxin system prevent-host-death family antitoxin [Microlunatus elymi]QDP97661.1 type II toxin-antitoxin system prevent-host-death family antitoxin [Microlunatus elymi]
MERIGVRELRQHATRYLALVKAGETVEVTDRGELVARLVPVTVAETVRDELIRAGQLAPAAQPRGRVRRRPATSGMTTAEALDLERGDQ